LANSRIDTANLPTTNDLTATGAGANTKFNLLTLRTAVSTPTNGQVRSSWRSGLHGK
jgi:hypothetical protein